MDNQRFTPSPFPGAPRFRLPWRSVYAPVVPCALDGTLSLLELIAKLEYVINQYSGSIEANHTDILNLAEDLETSLNDLREYIDAQDALTLNAAQVYADGLDAALRVYIDAQDADTLELAKAYAESLRDALRIYVDQQDAATLASAKAYAESLRDALRIYVDQQDAATLASAKAYAESLRDTLRIYVDQQDAATLAAAKTYAENLRDALKDYVDTQDAATLAAAKTYADGLVSTLRVYVDAQLALKQDVLTFDTTPTDGSSNPVTSDGIYDALAAKLNSSAVVDDIIEDDMRPVTSGAVYAAIDELNQRQPVILNFTYDVDTTTLTPVTANAYIVATAALNADRIVYAVLTVSGTFTPQRADKYYLWLDKYSGGNMLTFTCTDYTLSGTMTGWTIS